MFTTRTAKRTIRNPEAFIGKRIDTTKWELPYGYDVCRMTGKFMAEDDLCVTFNHYAFEKSFLVANSIYIEDAEWLSEEGYDLIMAKLEQLGFYDAYRAWFDTDMQSEIDVYGTKETEMNLTAIPTAFVDFIERLFPADSAYEAAEAANDADTAEYIEQGSEVVFLANTGDFRGCVEAVDVDAQKALVRYADTNTHAEMLQWLSVNWLALA